MTDQGLIVACPSCETRLRLARGAELPARFKVRCTSCATAFVVKRRPEGQERTIRLESSGDARSVAAKMTVAPPTSSPALSTQTTSSSAPQLTFRRGEMVAERYRIDRFIAKGGMGEVYEAFDTALGSPVAIKTIRPDLAADHQAVERFKREVMIARQVTHRNVCRIFDLGTHRSDSPLAALYPDGEILFVSMELLHGETLTERLSRGGPFELGEALSITVQIAKALDAAHAAGIVHRDLKSMNVMLEPTERGRSRVVVTDFGLARSATSEMAGGTLTVAGAVLGSPAYMAPEQIEGGSITTAVDIYAFGVVLYEMVAGKVPFRGESPMSTALKRLTENPPPPSELRPGLDERWEATILRCLERNPSNRFGSADEAVAHLTGRDEPRAPAEIGGVPRRRIYTAVVAGFLLAIAIVVNFWAWQRRAEEGEEVAAGFLEPPEIARPAVAMMGFRNATGKENVEWMSTGLAEMLASELSVGLGVRIVPGENISRAQLELGLMPGDSFSFETLSQLRANLGADWVVTGSYAVVDGGDAGHLRVDVRLQDTMTEGNATAVSVNGGQDEVFDLVAQMGARLREALQLADVSQQEVYRASSQEAARLYTEGLEQLRRFDALGARDKLEAAAAADPRNPRVHAALASALSSLGFVQRAQVAAKTALDLSAPLSEEERQEIRARVLVLTGQWAQAAVAYEALWRGQPDNLEYGLELAQAFTSSGRPTQSLQVSDVLEQLPSAAAGDVRILLAEATAAGALGRFEQQRRAAAEAADRSSDQGAKLLRARALLLEGWALRNLGDVERAQGVTAEAEGLYQQAGDPSGVAGARVQRASLLYDQGDLATARRMFERAIETYEELGDKGNQAQATNNLAVVLRQQGSTARAQELYETSLALSRETGNRIGIANALTNIGAIESKLGNLSAALERLEESSGIAREIGDRNQEANALYTLGVTLRKRGDLAGAEVNHQAALELRRSMGQRINEAASLTDLGNVALARGDLVEAKGRYDEALGTARELGNRRFEAYALFGLGLVRYEEGDGDTARQYLDQALEIRSDLGESTTIAETRLLLARLDLAQGRYAEAEATASDAVERFGGQGLADDLAVARAVRARSLVFLDRRREAQSTVASALARVAVSENLVTQVEVEIAAARVEAAGDPGPGALDRLRAVEERVHQAGFTSHWLEALLLRGRIARSDGHDALAQELLGEVEVQARRSGLGRLEALAAE